ncbi:MAG: hypothetical protein AAB822_00790 [Patescibacteria group bacterium]
MLIIPAINAQTFDEVQKKIKLIEPHVSWVHLDIADGTFTKNTLWHNLLEFSMLETELNIELHFMMDRIEERIDHWLNIMVKKVIFHIDASKDPGFVIDRCHKNKTEVGIAISSDESIAKAMAFKDKIDFFQILGVKPGLPGQKMDENTFDRIREVRKFCPSCIIEVDGGMNKETIPKAISAGANIIVSANAIFNSGKNIKDAIEELKKLK